ncbi:MAG: molecular chaperone [Bacteroidetes bacterium 4572_114]|nr:MAG: molecular chaperone [Bacteroidetes bacterium 4572_114]
MLRSGQFQILIASLRIRYFLTILTGAILLSVFLPVKTMAQGDLLITPRRVVFDGAKKTRQINLANNGQDTATYVISFKQYKMLVDGSFEEITEPDPGQNFASNNLRFFPRSVTLAPNEAQVVKLQLSKTSGLGPGEYRSHIYFRSVPDVKPLGEEDKPADSTVLSISLTPIFGITIPVIFRIGETYADVTLSNLAIVMGDNTKPQLMITFNRTGNMSVYGNIEVDHVSPSGVVTRVGIVKGLAVYTPNEERNFQLDLLDADVDYNSGKLMVKYVAASDVRASTLAEAELLLQ